MPREGKKQTCLELSEELVKKVNLKLVKIHGRTFGYFTKTVEDGLNLWLEQQKASS